MKIEHTLRRFSDKPENHGTKVPMGKETYHFRPTKDDERHVAEVTNEAHIARFLAIPEFVPAPGEVAPIKQVAVVTEFKGSAHPQLVRVADGEMSLGEVVKLLAGEAELSAEQWNVMSDLQRYDMIEAWLQKHQAPKGDADDETGDPQKDRIDPKSLTASERLAGAPDDANTAPKPLDQMTDKALKGLAKRYGVDESLARAYLVAALVPYHNA